MDRAPLLDFPLLAKDGQPPNSSGLILRDGDEILSIENDPELLSLLFHPKAEKTQLESGFASKNSHKVRLSNDDGNLQSEEPANMLSNFNVQAGVDNGNASSDLRHFAEKTIEANSNDSGNIAPENNFLKLEVIFFYSGGNGVSIVMKAFTKPNGVSKSKFALGSFLTANTASSFVVSLLNAMETDFEYHEEEFLEISYSAPSLAGFWKMHIKNYLKSLKKLNEWIRYNAVPPSSPSVQIFEIPTYVRNLIKSCHPLYSQHSIERIYFHRDESPLSRIIDGVESSLRSSLGPHLYDHLKSFQKQGVIFSILHDGRALIADEPGLGKTIQAIALACYYRKDWPCLVICPAGLKNMWAREFARWVPELKEDDIQCNNKSRPMHALVNIYSYETIKSHTMYEKIGPIIEKNCDGGLPFGIVICDESHMLKKWNSIRTCKIFPLVKLSRRAIFLSGTPATSYPQELYTQISALKPRIFFNFFDYAYRYCNPIPSYAGVKYSGASNMLELNAILCECVMIRRRKDQVQSEIADNMPKKIRHKVIIDIPPEKLQVLESLNTNLNFERDGVKALLSNAHLMKLFHKCGLFKLPATLKHLQVKLEEDNKVLIFAQHLNIINSISEFLEANSFDYIKIDGATPINIRQKLVDHFQNTPDCRVGILSISCASTGITLNTANVVIFAELFWNPGILLQAEDRAHRIGQRKEVHVYYLVANKTVDDKIWSLIEGKSSILCEMLDKKSDHQLSSQSIKDMADFEEEDSPYYQDSFLRYISKKNLELEERYHQIEKSTIAKDYIEMQVKKRLSDSKDGERDYLTVLSSDDENYSKIEDFPSPSSDSATSSLHQHLSKKRNSKLDQFALGI